MNGAQMERSRSRDTGASSLEGLALCEGFMVDSSECHVGVVDTLRYAPSTRWDRPTALAVHAGRSGDVLLIVPVAEVERVVPEERRVVLRPSPRITGTERATASRR